MTKVDFTHLTPTDTVTACPYKGTTSGYWTAHHGDTSDDSQKFQQPTAPSGLLTASRVGPSGTQHARDPAVISSSSGSLLG